MHLETQILFNNTYLYLKLQRSYINYKQDTILKLFIISSVRI